MTKTGRNELCSCGSGKKYKKCCLEKDQANQKRSPSPIDLRVEGVAEEEAFCVGPEEDEINESFDDNEYDVPGEPEEEGEEPDLMAESVHYNKPREELPKLSADQQSLVDTWWEEIKPLFKLPDADGMIRMVLEFMEKHPQLFVHLGLEHEVLFEIGAELGRRKEWSRYAELLMRIRQGHPEMYIRSFSYYDLDLIVESLVAGKEETVADYFNYFHQFPDSQPDNAGRVVDLLAWLGRQDDLFAFVKPLAIPMWLSPDVIGGWFIMRWLVFAQYVPLLEMRFDPDDAAQTLMAAVRQLDIPNGPEFDAYQLQREFRFRRDAPEVWDISTLPKDYKIAQFYRDVRWNYSAFLHDVKGFPWVRSDYLAQRLETYWADRSSGKRPKNTFRLSYKGLDAYIADKCRDFFSINGVQAISLIEAVRHFADYLAAHSQIDAEKVEEIRTWSQHLFELCMRVVDSTDPIRRLRPIGFDFSEV